MYRKKDRSITPYIEEKTLLDAGYSLIAGIDEVGRGPLAGPVVAGVVMLPPNPDGDWVGEIQDSKKMTSIQRERSYCHLREQSIATATGIVSAEEIDQIGIAPSTFLAMKRALYTLPLQPQYLLIDAFQLKDVNIPQKAIVKGDSLSLSIAAASIVAKVTRDRIMKDLEKVYPGYGFAKNKGYGSSEHILKLKQLGPCQIHRYSFAPIRNWTSNPGYSRTEDSKE